MASRPAASTEFYGDVVGFRVVSEFPGAAFLQAPDSTNDHDLGLFQIGATAAPSDAGRSTVGLYHLAWEVTPSANSSALPVCCANEVRSSAPATTAPPRVCTPGDPDGIEFEIVRIIPARSLTADDIAARASVGPLDLPAEIERFGRHEVGGVGVSISQTPTTPTADEGDVTT